MRKFFLCFLSVFFAVGIFIVSSFGVVSSSAEESSDLVGDTLASSSGSSSVASDFDLSKYPSANLIPFPYSDGSSKTVNGVTFTVNSDGSVTVNGTATGENAVFYLCSNKSVSLSSFGFLSGCPTGGSGSTYNIQIYDSTYYFDNGSGVSVPAGVYNLVIAIFSGCTVNNLVFKPMLNQGSIAYPFQPYIPNLIQQGYDEGEQNGYDSGYQAGYEGAVSDLSNVLIAQGNSSYALLSGNVIDYQATSTSLTFDTMTGTDGYNSGLPSEPHVKLKLSASVSVNSRYTITYSSLVGNCSLSFYYKGVAFSLCTLPASSSSMTVEFTLPYTLDAVVNSFVLKGYQDPLEFDFDLNHYTTGGPCTVTDLKIYCVYDSDQAFQSGYNQGHAQGYDDGYNVGQQAGYNQGLSDGSDYSFFGLFSAIIDAPVQAFTSLLNFEIFGVNVKNFALAILTCVLIVAGFRLFSGMGGG